MSDRAKFSTSRECFSSCANALIGDQHLCKHLEHCNSNSSGIHSSAYVLCTQRLNQEWPHTSNECNYHKYYNEPILELNRTAKPNKDWQKNFFLQTSSHWLRVSQFHQVLHHFHFLTLLDGELTQPFKFSLPTQKFFTFFSPLFITFIICGFISYRVLTLNMLYQHTEHFKYNL